MSSAGDRLHRYGPTTGDRVRLADTGLRVRVERSLVGEGDELRFGGGKVLSDGMGQSSRDGGLDLVIAGGLLLDPVEGAVVCDIGVVDGRIAGVGRAGNPDIMDGVDPALVVTARTEVISAHGCIVTPGGIDSHVHWIGPDLAHRQPWTHRRPPRPGVLVERGDDLPAHPHRAGLQVLHGQQRGLVGGQRRAAHRVGGDPHHVVVLVCVGEGVVHADVGEAAEEAQRPRPQAAEQDVEVGAEERRVAAIGHVVLVGLRPQPWMQRGAGVVLEAVRPLAAVELTPEVDPGARVALLHEDDRDADLARRLDDLDRALEPLLESRHVRDRTVHGGAVLLHVDGQDHRLAHQEIGHSTHLYGHGKDNLPGFYPSVSRHDAACPLGRSPGRRPRAPPRWGPLSAGGKVSPKDLSDQPSGTLDASRESGPPLSCGTTNPGSR